jgi:hypothetical protein
VAEQGRETRRQRPPSQPLVEPERRRSPIHHRAPGDGTIEGETLRDDPLKERGGGGAITEVSICTRKEPILPREGVSTMKPMYKIKQQTPILPVEILDTETALLLRQ